MEYGISVVLVAIPGFLASSAVVLLKTLSDALAWLFGPFVLFKDQQM